MECADVRMRECGSRAGFAHETLPQQRSVGGLVSNHFDGDDSIEPTITRAVDFAHPAGADYLLDFVRAEPSTCR
jgi:hypothetical protein